jgi:hypothetical protein
LHTDCNIFINSIEIIQNIPGLYKQRILFLQEDY